MEFFISNIKLTIKQKRNRGNYTLPNVTQGVRSIDFVQSIGVNIKGSLLYNGYANSSLIIQSLNYIGVSNVRDAIVQYGKAAPVLDALAEAGIKFDFRVSSTLPSKGADGMAEYVAMLKDFQAEHQGAILSIEGLNEANAFYFSYNGDSSIAGAAAFQQYLYTAIKADSQLANIPVYNFTIADHSDASYAAMGDLGAYSDAANIHLYMSTSGSGDPRMEYVMGLGRGASRGDPLVVTEIGHPTLRTEPGIGTSQKAQAKMMLSELLLAYENGSQATFIYELFDNSASRPRGEKEVYFGLFSEAGNPKPAAIALHNLTTILTSGDDGGADGVLPVAFSVQSSASTVHAMSFEKSGGVYDIAVWNDRPVWNDATDTDYTNPVVSTVVDLGRVESIVRVYDPMTGLVPIATYRNVSSVTLPLRDSPLIIEVGASDVVREPTLVSAANLTLTSAALVAQIDTLALSSGLQQITLTDTHVLSVSTKETMAYMISAYAGTLGKIAGGFSFAVTYGESNWTKVQNFDARGVLTLTTDYTLQNGAVISKAIFQTDGSRDNYRYGIEGKSYVTEHQALDPTGRLALLERFHADGSYDLRDVRNADGSRIYEAYDAAGQMTNSMLTGADGGTTARSYNAAGQIASQVVKEADGDILTTIYTNGVHTKLTIVSHDGWQQLTTYSASTGLILTDSRTEADGSRLYSVYDASGRLTSTSATAADGSKLYTAYLQDGTGDVRADAFNAAGAMLTRDVTHLDGTHDVYAYADNQRLQGGALDDIFYFRTTGGGRMIFEGGDDTVRNFNTDATGVDRIVIDDQWATRFSDLSLSQQGADVLIRFNSEDSILIKQQTVGNLLPDHFLFV